MSTDDRNVSNKIMVHNLTETSEDSTIEFSPKTFAEVFVASLKIVIGLVGFLGNLTVCIVVAKMRSQRNCANSLIVSQAVIDLFTSLVLVATTFTEIFPASPPQNAVFGYFYCVFWHSRIAMFSMFTISTFNLVAISLERYIAVIYPIWYSHNFSRKTATLFGILAWLLAPLMQTIIGFTHFTFVSGSCVYITVTHAVQATTGVILFLYDFFVPCIVMAFCFVRISIKFHNQNKRVGASDRSSTRTSTTQVSTISRANPGNKDGTAENAEEVDNGGTKQNISAAKKVGRGRNITKTLVIVFLVFVICWSPDQFLFLQWNCGGTINFGGVLHSTVVIMAMVNSACNPFIYALRYKQYQEGLKSLFKRKK